MTSVATTLRAELRPFGLRLPLIGVSVFSAFAMAVVLWSTLAPLGDAVVAPGVMVVQSNIRTIQHLEGGIVSEILVREGDRVTAGQPLVRLQQTATSSNLNELRSEYDNALAMEARLIAERDRLSAIAFPPELTSRPNDAAAANAISSQQAIFESRKALLRERLNIQLATASGHQGEVSGLDAQIESNRRRLAFLNQELASLTQLAERGYVTKTRVLGLQQQQAALDATIQGLQGARSAAQSKTREVRYQMMELHASTVDEIVTALKDTQKQLYELRQKLQAAEDVANRTEIRSPLAGTVVGLSVHTVGGVVAPGAVIMNIVPTGERLVVQANIDPADIDQVRIGMPASVWLAAISRRNQEPLEGVVKTISADRLQDRRTGAVYYSAQVELRTDTLKGRAIALQPGMNADVMIQTGARSALEYVLGPLVQTMRLASR